MGGPSTETAYVERVLTYVRSWPTLSTEDAECGNGVGLSIGSCQVAHLHREGEAELFLGEPVVGRLRHALTLAERVTIDEGSVRVRLESDNDVRLVLSLLSVSIKVCKGPARCDRNGPWCCAHRVPA
jgi:hypothetical protein